MTTISKICLSCPVEIEEPEIMNKCYMCNALEGLKSMIDIECICRVCSAPFYVPLDHILSNAILNTDLNIISIEGKKITCTTEDCLGFQFQLGIEEGASVG